MIAQDEVGGGIWLNGYAARQGAARVRTYPDNAKRARRLLAMEQKARAAKRGLWADDHWRVRGVDDLAGAPYFAIVEGEVAALRKMAGDGEAHLARGGRGAGGRDARACADGSIRGPANRRSA